MTDAMRSEWVKLTTLRSNRSSLFFYVLVCLSVNGLFSSLSRGRHHPHDSVDAIGLGFAGLQTGMILMVIVAVLAITGEYTTGTIKSSLLATPNRRTFYAGKVLTIATVAGALSAVVSVAGFFLSQSVLGSFGVPFDGDILGRMIGGVLYTTLLALFSLGLGTVLKSSTVTLGTLIPLFFMLSTMLNSIPATHKVAQFLPDMAGSLILRRDIPADTLLNGWTGTAVLAAWAIAALLAGYTALERRDA
ncbi:ABC transporter permease subunit [Streptomyces sp. NPDC002589]|uniref:ABC transporter permease subunit n=1 Tax=Streptomyces sp. NPDC002589 TaxID=3154420 RepID=UPI0033319DBF